MKKSLLSLVASFMACMAIADGLYYHLDFYFDKMSSNGKWLATQTMGTVYIYDRDKDTYYEFIASEDAVSEYYATGIGNCWSDDGILVGSVNDVDCAYWMDEEWNELPINREENLGLNIANGITPDGSRIVGSVGISSISIYSEQMIKPVYWDRLPDGSYDMYKELPYPATDFCGRVPQYISAVCISDDGKTILGQIVDWSGWYIYPIVYQQQADGSWTYKTYAEGILYPKGSTFGVWPGEEPTAPNGTEFMSEEELAVYSVDYNNYMDAYNKFLNDQLDWEDVPEEPNPADYIKDADRLAAYLAALQEYQDTLNEYYRKSSEFEMQLANTMYGNSFIFNNLYISGNGQYINSTIRGVDVSDPTRPKSVYTPTCINLNDGSMTSVAGATDMIASSVMNDGRSIAQNPFMAYGRNSFIVSTDGKTMTPFIDYLAQMNYDAWEFVKDISTYDVLYVESYDDYGNPSYGVYNDSIVVGSVHCNSNGTIFTSFMYDEWSEGNVTRQFSYQIDFNEFEGVENIENDAIGAYAVNNTLYLNGNAEKVTIYNLQGAVVARYNNPSSTIALHLTGGIYLVEVSDKACSYVNKVIIK